MKPWTPNNKTFYATNPNLDPNSYFIICTDASLHFKDGKCVFGCAIVFKDTIVYAMSFRGGFYSISKEAKARTILFALSKARES